MFILETPSNSLWERNRPFYKAFIITLVIISYVFAELLHPSNKQVDEPSCSTPRKRSFNLPTIASIEELRTPAFEELLKSIWDAKSAKQINGDTKHVAAAFEAAQSLRDPRVPLTAIN
jgi:kinesin family protein 11